LYRIEMNEDWCKRCYICLELCPKKVLAKGDKVSPKGGLPVVVRNPKDCTGCRNCELLCPDQAITVEET
jgi:2-oxoglutarate ferredoxin oxidoreductase subunit delta